MARVRYLVSTKKPGLEFQVLKVEKVDDTSVRATLLGAHGVTFDKMINDEILARYGYSIQVREVADAGAPA